jgi:FAD/FMN-containing dehydrogenase
VRATDSMSRRKLLTTAAASVVLIPRLAPAAAAQAVAAASAPVVLNDASRLNPVAVASHAVIRTEAEQGLIAELRALLADAARDGRPLCVGGARHSMGGQSLPRDGVAVSPIAPLCEPDTAARTYRVRGGARWRDVIRALDPHGFSVAVMQSNNDFSVAGTLSVNAHGWPVPFGPFGRTVRSFRLMLADGTIVTCSPTENAKLFGLVIGGYGLFGIVIDADLAMVENMLLLPTYERMAAVSAVGRFTAVVHEPPVRMAYVRLSVARADFLRDALIVTYRPAAVQPASLPQANQSGAYTFLSRRIFRQQIGSERGKRSRWYAETVLLPRAAAGRPITRNAILNYPVSVLAETSPRRTDILHEYFLPPERFENFLVACREIIPRAKLDLLNVTLRYVEADPVSVLAFAPAPRIAAVLLFSQGTTAEADRAMAAMTQRLIDAVLALGGSFYLPYRLHARVDQLRAAYPKLDEFIAQKRHYDPQLRFRNLMWDRYFA